MKRCGKYKTKHPSGAEMARRQRQREHDKGFKIVQSGSDGILKLKPLANGGYQVTGPVVNYRDFVP